MYRIQCASADLTPASKPSSLIFQRSMAGLTLSTSQLPNLKVQCLTIIRQSKKLKISSVECSPYSLIMKLAVVFKRNDTELMAVLVRRFGQQSVVTFLRANLSQSGLVVAFLAKLYRSLKYQPRERQSVRQTKSVFRSVLAIFIPSLQFPQDRAISKSRRTKNQISDKIYEPAFLLSLVMPEELVDLFGHCEMLRPNTEVVTFLIAIRNKCATGKVDKAVIPGTNAHFPTTRSLSSTYAD